MPAWGIFADKKLSSEQRESLHALAVQIFAGTTVLMIGALILMSFTLSSLKEARSLNEATEDKLLAMTTIESRLIDSDGALSGFAMSRDPWFRARILSNRKELNETAAWLGNALRGDPELYALYRTMQSDLTRRQHLYDYLSDPAHQDEIDHVDRSRIAAEERHLTDEVRGHLWKLLKRERARRFAHHTEMIRQATNRVWVAVGMVVLALISGAVSLFLANLGRPPRRE